MSNSEPNAVPIDDQLIFIVRNARAAGYDDGAEWIQKQATAFLWRETAEVSEARIVERHAGSVTGGLDEMARGWGAVLRYGAHDPDCSEKLGLDECCECGFSDVLIEARNATGTADESDPPAPEPSRTDAVKEAIALIEGVAELGMPNIGIDAKKVLPLVAALAGAERKLADANACSTCGGMAPSSGIKCVCGGTNSREHETDGLRNCTYDAAVKFTAAEKRAKEAAQQRDTCLANYRNLYYTKVVRPVEIENAALTRKLATARNAIHEGLRLIGYPPDGTNIRNDEIKNFHDLKVAFDNVLAAIDAPAGEEGTTADYLDIVFDGPPSHMTGRFVEVESPAGIGVKVGEWIDRGDGYWALRIPRDRAATPPPEPANAQGSEACVLCGEHVDGNGCNCDCHEDDPLPTPAPPSPQPFTVEEARVQAAINFYSWDYLRTVATLRHYADLLERDDTLERAAEDVVKAWTDDRPVNSAILNLRSVLAQRAKEKR